MLLIHCSLDSFRNSAVWSDSTCGNRVLIRTHLHHDHHLHHIFIMSSEHWKMSNIISRLSGRRSGNLHYSPVVSRLCDSRHPYSRLSIRPGSTGTLRSETVFLRCLWFPLRLCFIRQESLDHRMWVHAWDWGQRSAWRMKTQCSEKVGLTWKKPRNHFHAKIASKFYK